MSRPRAGLALLVLAAVAFPARPGRAADGGKEGPEDRQLKARELFRDGSLLYEQAHYDEAIARFEEAYRLSSRPALLFNIAQAYRLKGPAYCATALRYYERHLQGEPDASNRTEIEELMQEMRLCAAAQSVAGPTLP